MSNIIIRPLPELQVIAKAIYESNFYGFKNQQQAFTAVIASQDMGMNATRFCQDYHIINNRPSKKTETAQTRWAGCISSTCRGTRRGGDGRTRAWPGFRTRGGRASESNSASAQCVPAGRTNATPQMQCTRRSTW